MVGWPADRHEWFRTFRKSCGEIRAEPYDVVLDLQGLMRSAGLARWAKAPLRIARCGQREGAHLVSFGVPLPDRPAHAVDEYLQLARYLGATMRPVEFNLPIQPRAVDAVDRLLKDAGVSEGSPLIVISPSPSQRWKAWPADRWAAGSLPPRLRRRRSGQGWLRLWVLELDGKPAAAWYGWRLRDRYSYYQAGFDPGYEKQSLGLVLLGRTIRAATEESAPVFDMLRGDEEYKLRFVTGERRIHTLALSRRTSPARVATAAESALWRAGQRLTPERRERARALYRRLDRFMPGGPSPLGVARRAANRLERRAQRQQQPEHLRELLGGEEVGHQHAIIATAGPRDDLHLLVPDRLEPARRLDTRSAGRSPGSRGRAAGRSRPAPPARAGRCCARPSASSMIWSVRVSSPGSSR